MVALECGKMMFNLVGKNVTTGKDERWRWFPRAHNIHSRADKNLTTWQELQCYFLSVQTLMCQSIVMNENTPASDVRQWYLWAQPGPDDGGVAGDACQPVVDIMCLVRSLEELIQRASPSSKAWAEKEVLRLWDVLSAQHMEKWKEYHAHLTAYALAMLNGTIVPPETVAAFST
jgi:hypothetical protein